MLAVLVKPCYLTPILNSMTTSVSKLVNASVAQQTRRPLFSIEVLVNCSVFIGSVPGSDKNTFISDYYVQRLVQDEDFCGSFTVSSLCSYGPRR